jgi:pimeloyl-ACP methyl ester carboxylesterase
MAAGAVAQAPLPEVTKPLEIATQGVFSVPGHYEQKANRTIMVGQMYVQYQIPKNKTRPYPIVLIHGGGQTAANFLSTPDGRRGWADDFLGNGYAVYVVDQVGRGRSGFVTEVYGNTRKPSVEEMTSRFSDTKRLWPQAELHTQWPGQGIKGDPTFDAFYATQVESIGDELTQEELNRDAVANLLDKIGPAVILVHSQAGTIGWTAADARPALVKGILAIEPSGPPIRNINAVGPPDYFADGAPLRPWGITRGKMTYDPPAESSDEIKIVRQEKPDGPGLVRCFMQAEPARKFTHFANIPILMVLSEASYHAPYDHCTSKWLTQSGVTHTFMRLSNIGIHGNGHMMMLEKNNLEISGFLAKWEQENVH